MERFSFFLKMTLLLWLITQVFEVSHEVQNLNLFICHSRVAIYSQYYSENPLFPLNKTVANINIDGANVYGRDNNQIQVIGSGYTALEDVLQQVVAQQGRTIIPDREPEKGYYFRSDQFSFAKKGVPALYTESTTVEDNQEYTANRYHKPSDQYNPSWDMKAAVRDSEALFHDLLQ